MENQAIIEARINEAEKYASICREEKDEKAMLRRIRARLGVRIMRMKKKLKLLTTKHK